jgi:hypothetical protein
MKGRTHASETKLKMRVAHVRHGHAIKYIHTSTYNSWSGMLQRCLNPNNTRFRYYGGRGITVCQRWLIFENFLADMGERPAGLSIDRKDNDGNYELGNCRWATQSQQVANRRRLAKVGV